MLLIRDCLYGTAILAFMGLVYTSLGTLNGRLAGGFTLDNRPWAICAGVFLVASLAGVVVKTVLVARRRRQKPFRSHPSGHGWIQDLPD